MKKRILLGLVMFLFSGHFLYAPAEALPIKMKGGVVIRIRHEFWKDLADMDSDSLDNRNYFRFRTSLWGQADYKENLSLFARLTNEFKPYMYFGGTSGSAADKYASKKGYHFDINEVVFDNLYLDIKKCFNLPVDLRLGRQDFIGEYGEGFLLYDGTPQDGSRTHYFNAAKAVWRIDEKNSLDFIYINDPRNEEYLPVINRTRLVRVSDPSRNRVEQPLNTTDELGGVLYWKNKAIKDLALEGYYIYKKEAQEGGTGLQSKEGSINTLGSYAKYQLNPWTFRGQFAAQTGNYGNASRRGFGGYGYLDRELKKLIWSPSATLGYIYLSGDKRDSAKNESWDPLFSRSPWISDLYNLSMSTETGISAYWTNLQACRAGFMLKPTTKAKFSFWYNFFRANAQVSASNVFSGVGKNRGTLLQSKMEYNFTKDISTYFLAEYLFSGNFYKERDDAIFLRTELQMKF